MGHSPDTVPVSPGGSRRVAVIAAGGSRRQVDVALVDEALRDPIAAVRATALGARAQQGRLDAPSLVTAMADPSPAVRRRAAQLAGSWQGRSDALTGKLIDSLGDEDPLFVIAVLVALADRQAMAAITAVSAVARTSSEPLVIEEAIATLGALGDPEGLAIILAVLPTAKAPLRRRCVAALGAFEGVEVEAALDKLSEDRDWQVRQAVAMLRRDG